MPHLENVSVSAAVFCPQNRPPKQEYLLEIRQFLCSNPLLIPFRNAILDLPKTWDLFAKANASLAAMEQGPKYTEYFRSWILNGDSTALTETMSGIISLPLLTIMQIVQYVQYLEARTITHDQLLQELRHGGTQGFCGGLLPVMAIASSKSEEDVVRSAAKCLRIALGIGAYGELGDDPDVPGPTTLALRLKHLGQAEELVSKFSGIYVSAVSDPLSISIVGPARILGKLKEYANSLGITATELYLRGKVHNPENDVLADELWRVCEEHPEVRLPDSAALRVPVRSNMTGEPLQPGISLSREIIRSTLVTRCEWYTLQEALASELAKTGQRDHRLIMFGTGRKNCVALSVFETRQLKATKLDVVDSINSSRSHSGISSSDTQGPSVDFFPDDSIAIVGAACRLPGADSIDNLWDVLSSSTIRASKIPSERFDPSRISRNNTSDSNAGGNRTWYGNFLDDVSSFDNSFFGVSPREAIYMDPQQKLLLETAYEALDGSGYLRHHQRDRFDNVGCFIGSTYTEYLENTSAYSPTAYTATGTIRAFQSGKISYYFGWSGPSEVIDTACSSSLVAINRACRAIQSGDCPMALAGGVNIITGIHNFLDLGKAGFLSPTGRCKPFEATADGYSRADGVGLVVLKSLRQAVASGDHILGVIPAVATNHGGLSPSITVPYSRAQTELFETVLRRAGMSSHQLSYVEAHGTGTQVGDPIEMGSIRKVFGQNGGEKRDPRPLYIGSIKANVGHSETAAGVGSLMKVLAMLQRSLIPPLAGFQVLNPNIPPLEADNLAINTEVLPWTPRASVKAALVNSYGAAGSNAALICSQAPRSQPPGPSLSDHGLRYPIILSAANVDSLHAYAGKLKSYLGKNSALRVSDVSFTLSERRKRHNVRWVGSVASLDSLIDTLDQGLHDSFTVPEAGSSRKPVVLTFSGQSKQTIQLEPLWYRSFPLLRQYLQQCDLLVTKLGHPSILSALFQSEPITDVVTLQCGTFAVQYACAKCWIDTGLVVSAVIGHSFGELTAMAVSGILCLEDAVKLVAARATLMKNKWGPERGTMLAVHAGRDVVEKVLQSVGGLEIACFNGPTSHVIVGSQSAIQKAESVMRENPYFVDRKIRSQRVDVSHGFHSVFTQEILEDLDQVAQTLNFRKDNTIIPLETCTQSHLTEITPSRIVEHTREPVYYEDALARLEIRLGACTFVEAGVNSPIMPMVKKAVKKDSQHVFIGTPKWDKDGITIMTLNLWREGITSSFWGHLAPDVQTLGAKPVWLPPYQFKRSNHWLSYADYAQETKTSLYQAKNHTEGHQSLLSTKLVTPKGRAPHSWASLVFDVHQRTKRFTDIVSGHAVRGQPLCPASLYMECALMAAQMIVPSGVSSGVALHFEDLSFQGALGINHDRDIVLEMAGAGEYQSWNYTLSSSVEQRSTRPTVHAKGRLSIRSPTDWQVYSRMIADRIENVKVDVRADRMTANRAYTLFSRVVDYSAVLRGISQVFMVGHQAVADIKRPSQPVSTEESTCSQICDSVSLDTFIQVAGLLVNSGETCPPDEVYIATHIESMSIQNCDFSRKSSTWSVYVMATPLDGGRSACDVFVLDEAGCLVVVAPRIQFTRYPIRKLERVLEHSGINSSPEQQKTSPGDLIALKSKLPPNGQVHSQKAVITMPSIGSRDDQRTLVNDGISPHQPTAALPSLLHNGSLRQLGLDSLSVVQLASRLMSEMNMGNLKDTADLSLKTVDIEVATEKFTASAEDVSSESSNDTMRHRQRIIELISENCASPVSNVDNSVSLEDIGIDSLSVVELKAALEDAFGLHLGYEDVALGSNIQEILNLVDRSRLVDQK